MSTRKLTSIVLAALGVLATTLALSAVPASAGIIHHYLSEQITGTPAGPLSPSVIAFDNAGNLLVGNANAIDVFSPANAFQKELAVGGKPESIAIDAATGDLYVGGLEAGRLRVYKPDGSGGYTQLSEWTGAHTPTASWSGSLRVAVDNSTGLTRSGDVYVAEGNNELVDVMKPNPPGPTEAEEGAFVTELAPPVTVGIHRFLFEQNLKVVVSRTAGEVYVTNHNEANTVGAVDEYEASGTFLGVLDGTGTPAGRFGEPGQFAQPTDIAVDAAGDLYAADPQHGVVDEFDPSGKYAGQIADPSAGSSETGLVGVAPSGDVYGAFGQVIDVFGPNLVVPDAIAGPAPGVGQRTVTLGGSVNPDGEPVTSCQFEFSGPEFSGARMLHRTLPCTSLPGSGNAPVAVSSAAIGELPPGGIYVYKVTAGNANGATPSKETTVRLQGVTPAVNDRPPVAQAITTTTAAVAATIDPGGRDTTYRIIYGTASAYGSSSASLDAGQGSFDEEATPVSIEGLEPGTLYHYAIVAENEAGEATGPDYTFTTAPLPTPPPPLPPAPAPPTFTNPLSIPTAPPLVATPSIAFPGGPSPPKTKAKPGCKHGYKRAKKGRCVRPGRVTGHRSGARRKRK